MQTSQQSFQAQLWGMVASVCEAQGIDPPDYQYQMYEHSDEEDAFEVVAERYFAGAETETQEDTGTHRADDAIPTEGNDDDGEEEPEYSPMEQEGHGSHTTTAADAYPLTLYDPTAVADVEDEDEDEEGDDTD